LKTALVILLLAYFIDWVSVLAWSVWTVETALGISDPCFLLNPTFNKFFYSVEDRDLKRHVKVPATLMPEIQAADYSYEALEILSRNWRQPVVVRGLFTNTSALQKWINADYLISHVFGSNETSVIRNGTIQHHVDRACRVHPLDYPFSSEKPFDEVMRGIEQGNSLETIVFPPASRSKRIRNAPLEAVFNRMVEEELDLKRIGGTFAAGISSTVLTQMFIGAYTPPNQSIPVGSGWHCDICNNFVVQIAGVKRWIMVDPIYSIYMRPTMIRGKTAIAGGHGSISSETLPHIPHYSVDLYPGDFLYNPEWYWHTIENQAVGPYSFGLVSRQCHMARNFKSNTLFTSLIVLNHAIAAIYDPEARQRMIAFLTASSLMKPEEGVNVKGKQDSGGYMSY